MAMSALIVGCSGIDLRAVRVTLRVSIIPFQTSLELGKWVKSRLVMKLTLTYLLFLLEYIELWMDLLMLAEAMIKSRLVALPKVRALVMLIATM